MKNDISLSPPWVDSAVLTMNGHLSSIPIADLIAISSTVIPITEYEVGARIGEPISEEYKKAYIKHLKKKKITLMDPDKLISKFSVFLFHHYVIVTLYFQRKNPFLAKRKVNRKKNQRKLLTFH
jgi:hypothetical protein